MNEWFSAAGAGSNCAPAAPIRRFWAAPPLHRLEDALRLPCSQISTTLTILSTIAYAALAVAGAVLWNRTRSLWTALIGVGFALVFPDQISAIVEYFQFNALLHGHPDDTFFLIHHHAFLRYVSIFGLWVAAVGLVWHAMGRRSVS
jgi:hypothetical protein